MDTKVGMMGTLSQLTNPMLPEATLENAIDRTNTEDDVGMITTLWPSMADVHDKLAKWVMDVPDPVNNTVTFLESCLLNARMSSISIKDVAHSDIARQYFWQLTQPLSRLGQVSVILSREDEDPDIDDYKIWDPLEESYYLWRLRHQRYDQLHIEAPSLRRNANKIDPDTVQSLVAGKLITRDLAHVLGKIRFDLAPDAVNE